MPKDYFGCNPNSMYFTYDYLNFTIVFLKEDMGTYSLQESYNHVASTFLGSEVLSSYVFSLDFFFASVNYLVSGGWQFDSFQCCMCLCFLVVPFYFYVTQVRSNLFHTDLFGEAFFLGATLIMEFKCMRNYA